jgi:hypothetical protein
MQTLTLQYDTNNALVKSILNSAVLAGAKIVESKKEVQRDADVLTAYQRILGKRKDNKYTDNEIFVFNSMLNAQKILEKYED